MGRQTKASTALWAELWSTPQAIAWEELGWTRVVARYCRKLLEAEKPDSPVALQAEVRQLEDRLGLTPMSMRRLQWETFDQPVLEPEADGEEAAEVTSLDDYRVLYGD